MIEKAEKALLKSEEKYRTLFNLIDQGFVLGELIRNKEGKGIDYYVHEVNSTYEKQTGISAEMVLGKTVLQSFPTIDKWWIETYAAVVDNQYPVRFEKFFEFTNRWFEIKASPAGEEMFTILFTDITERILSVEKIKESEERFRTLAESLPQLVWITDGDGKFEFGSKRWFAYTGVEPGSEGELEKIIHPDDIHKMNAEWNKCLKSGKTYSFDVRIKSKNGNYRWHTSMGEPVKNTENKIIKWVGAFTDTHAEKTFTKELELQVQERTKELEQNNSELQKMNKELESFNYISSHDLQEPLRQIQNFASRINDTEKQNLSDKGKTYFEKMNNAANRMQTLIADLLAYSRTKTQERKFEITDLNIIVEQVKTELKETIDQKHATIDVGEMCSAKIIPFQFLQLMHNLIDNALKFSKLEIATHIIIKSNTTKGSNLNNEKLSPALNYCHITVSDNGIGFEPQYKDRIFEVFQRLHDKQKIAGTGIGLAIVKKIVENHNGIITATSQLNEGATFDIYIPVS